MVSFSETKNIDQNELNDDFLSAMDLHPFSLNSGPQLILKFLDSISQMPRLLTSDAHECI